MSKHFKIGASLIWVKSSEFGNIIRITGGKTWHFFYQVFGGGSGKVNLGTLKDSIAKIEGDAVPTSTVITNEALDKPYHWFRSTSPTPARYNLTDPASLRTIWAGGDFGTHTGAPAAAAGPKGAFMVTQLSTTAVGLATTEGHKRTIAPWLGGTPTAFATEDDYYFAYWESGADAFFFVRAASADPAGGGFGIVIGPAAMQHLQMITLVRQTKDDLMYPLLSSDALTLSINSVKLGFVGDFTVPFGGSGACTAAPDCFSVASMADYYVVFSPKGYDPDANLPSLALPHVMKATANRSGGVLTGYSYSVGSNSVITGDDLLEPRGAGQFTTQVGAAKNASWVLLTTYKWPIEISPETGDAWLFAYWFGDDGSLVQASDHILMTPASTTFPFLGTQTAAYIAFGMPVFGDQGASRLEIWSPSFGASPLTFDSLGLDVAPVGNHAIATKTVYYCHAAAGSGGRWIVGSDGSIMDINAVFAANPGYSGITYLGFRCGGQDDTETVYLVGKATFTPATGPAVTRVFHITQAGAFFPYDHPTGQVPISVLYPSPAPILVMQRLA
jgi:hypothetical protein